MQADDASVPHGTAERRLKTTMSPAPASAGWHRKTSSTAGGWSRIASDCITSPRSTRGGRSVNPALLI